jgi:hypothetical protein
MKELLSVNFWDTPRKIYYHDGHEIGGYYHHERNFTFITVPKAGHFLPYGNYKASKAFLDDYVKYKHLKCRDPTKENCSVEKKMCAAMKGCGKGKCHNGYCVCPNAVKGADCSYNAHTESFVHKTRGTKWIYYQSSDGTGVTISSSDRPISVYISMGADSNPNKFKHDVSFKKVEAKTSLPLRSLPGSEKGYVIAIEVHGVDAGHNKSLDNSVKVIKDGTMA